MLNIVKFLFLKVQGNKLYGFELRLHENQLVLESIKYNTQKDQVALYMRFLASVQISKLPTQAPTPKTSTSSPTVRKTPVPAPSPAMVNFPPSPPLASSKAPVSPPSSISTPVKAPGLAQSSTVLDRVGFAAGSVGSGFATRSVGSGFATGSAGSRFAFVLDLGLLLDLGSLPFWI